jgi:hypothetical protein
VGSMDSAVEEGWVRWEPARARAAAEGCSLGAGVGGGGG